MPDILVRDVRREMSELVKESSFIFSGTVIELGASSVANLEPRENFAVIRIDRALRFDPALGDLRGRAVTVALLDRGELQPGNRMIFFASDWIHGGGIAAREIAHVLPQLEDEVTVEVKLLPERHLADRLADAVLVVIANVLRVIPTPFDISWRNAPQWAAASLQIVKVLRGEPTQNAKVLFPTSQRPTWLRAPHLSKGQHAIFLLHRPPDWVSVSDSESRPPSEVFTVLDPADVQPESQRQLVERLLSQGSKR